MFLDDAINSNDLMALILNTELIVAYQIHMYGLNAELPFENGIQELHNTLHKGVEFYVQNTSGHIITWGNVKNVLWGIKLYLVEGRRSNVCHFQFSTGGRPDRIGQGQITMS